MRHDILKLYSERQRIGSSERSLKTRLRLDPRLDYESGDYDWGPTRLSSARRRQEGQGVFHKRRNYNSRALYQFLDKAVGRSWDDVYSEIRQTFDHRSTVGDEFLRTLKWAVEHRIVMVNGVPHETRWHYTCHYGFYVDPETGILSENRYVRQPRAPKPVDSIHYHDNVWFKLETRRRSCCGCDRSWFSDNGFCQHHNKLVERKIWFVIEYGWHGPDEIYRDYYDSYGERHTTYYRDVPEKLKEPFEIRRKVANHKELRIINYHLT